MKLFIDSGSVKEVRESAELGVISGATTNPSLLAKEDGDPSESILEICELVRGPVSAEVVAKDAAGMIAEGRALYSLNPDYIVVKVPFSGAGLAATAELSSQGIPVNMTLVFSPSQALMAAEAGATYISCFMGRLDDISVDSTAVMSEIASALECSESSSQLLAASIRHPEHVVTAARIGCEVTTLPAKVLFQMLKHPLTESGIAQFDADWESRPEFGSWLQKIANEYR